MNGKRGEVMRSYRKVTYCVGQRGNGIGLFPVFLCILSILLTMVFITDVAADTPPEDDSSPEMHFEEGDMYLSWRGSKVLTNPETPAQKVVFEEREVAEGNDYWNYSYSAADTDDYEVNFRPEAKEIEHTYNWGKTTTAYNLDDDCLRIKISVRNQADLPIANFRFNMLDLHPESSLDKLDEGDVRVTHDRPTAIGLKTDIGQIFASYESFQPPIRFGFGAATGDEDSDPTYPLLAAGGVKATMPGELVLARKGNPQIPPGETLELEFALRFADIDERRNWVLRNFYKDYQEFLSPTLEWPDNRPIGAVYIFQEFGKEGPQFGVEGTNPRRLWSPLLDSVDVLSPHGRAFIRRALRKTAYDTVETLEKMDAQGMILWNMEGGYHSTGWVGAPRMLPILVPELNDAIDDYFQIIRDAGFRVGVTIRHPQLRWRGDGWVQGVGNANPDSDPLLDNFHELVPDHTPWWQVYPITQRLSRKIEYAKNRWGCTIFFYDTNNVLRYYGGNDQKKVTDNPAGHVYRKLIEEHPDVLIIPEFYKKRGTHINHLAYTAPYGQTGYGRVLPKWEEEFTRDLIPGYFGFNYVHDSGGDPWKPRRDRIHEVVWGEILGVDGWSFNHKQHAVSEYYRQGRAKQQRITSLARRYGMIDDTENTENREALPLYALLDDQFRIKSSDIVANPPASNQLRVYGNSADDGKSGVLFLAWYGWPLAPGTQLQASLPGLDLDGDYFWVWDLETGKLLNSGDKIKVPSAPVTSMRALFIRASDSAPPELPKEGLNLAASFDNDLSPDVGGGLVQSHGNGTRTDGHDGKGLKIGQNSGRVQYGVVPSWFSGTLEFDLNVSDTGGDEIPIAHLTHHLDTTLSVKTTGRTPVLKLLTHERDAEVAHYRSTALSPIPEEDPQPRQTSVNLSAEKDWYHVILTWEMGQYCLYVDGELVARLSKPAILRWRDETILEPGLILGTDKEQDDPPTAIIDSLCLYDWTFPDSQAKDRGSVSGIDPASRPENKEPSVWLWGNHPKEATKAAVNYRQSNKGKRIKSIDVKLFEKTDDGLRELSSGNAMAYRGTAPILLEYEPKITEDHATPEGDDDDDDDDDDLANDVMGEVRRAKKEYVLRIKAKAPGDNPPSRDINFRFEDPDEETRHW